MDSDIRNLCILVTQQIILFIRLFNLGARVDTYINLKNALHFDYR